MRKQDDHTLNAYAESFTQDVKKGDEELTATWISVTRQWTEIGYWTEDDLFRFRDICKEKYSPLTGHG